MPFSGMLSLVYVWVGVQNAWSRFVNGAGVSPLSGVVQLKLRRVGLGLSTDRWQSCSCSKLMCQQEALSPLDQVKPNTSVASGHHALEGLP